MSRKMLINAQHPEQLRVAVVDGTALDAYEIEVAESGVSRGNIYRGVIASIEPSLNAAFIEYGAERHGFLSGDDLVKDAFHRKPPKDERRPRVEQVLERGKPVLIQVVKDALGRKGAAMTTSLTLAGRYLVLSPFDPTIGVSRKVDDEEARKQLREKLDGLTLPDGFGVIARTNALQQNKTTLNRDLNALVRLWKRISKEASSGRGPRLLYSDQDLVVQALRDHLDNTIDELVVDNDVVMKKAERYIKAFLPRTKIKLTRYEERIPLFARYHLESEVDKIYAREVSLPCGGAIVIDRTEALTAIDVNSGKSSKGGGHEETVLRANLEAADEIARHLRLRDIGGLVIVDFIDMRFRKNQRKVEQAMRQAVKPDRARIKLERLSPNGLMEINRQRMKQQLQLQTHRACPTCTGAGVIASRDFVSLSVLRRIEARAAAGGLKAVRIALHPELADALQNGRRRELAALEQEFGIHIEVISGAGLHRSEERVEWLRREPGKEAPKPARKIRPAITASDLVDEGKPEAADSESGNGERKKRRRRRRRRRKGGNDEGGNENAESVAAKTNDSQEKRSRDTENRDDENKKRSSGDDRQKQRSDSDPEDSEGGKSDARRRSRSRSSRSLRPEETSRDSSDRRSSEDDSAPRDNRERSRSRRPRRDEVQSEDDTRDRSQQRPSRRERSDDDNSEGAARRRRPPRRRAPREDGDEGERRRPSRQRDSSQRDTDQRDSEQRDDRQRDTNQRDTNQRDTDQSDADQRDGQRRDTQRRDTQRRDNRRRETRSRDDEPRRGSTPKPLDADASAGGESAVRLFAASEEPAPARRRSVRDDNEGGLEEPTVDRLRPPRRRPPRRRSSIKLETAKPESKGRKDDSSDSSDGEERPASRRPRRRTSSPRRDRETVESPAGDDN